MNADKLYDSLRSHLRVTARVVRKTGKDINVREKFVMRFSVSNAAYSATRVDLPSIIFDKAAIYVEGTEYAKPVSGDRWHPVADEKLFPGEASSVDVEMVATRDIDSYWLDRFSAERVARVWVQARLDEAAFFQVWNYRVVHQEIEPT